VPEESEKYLRQKHYNQFYRDVTEQYQGETPVLTPELIEKIKVLEEFSPDKKRFFILFSHEKFAPIYISENVEAAGGYSPEEIYKNGLLFMFTHIHWKQLKAIYHMIRWGARYSKIVDSRASILSQEAYFCGIKFKDRRKNWRAVFMKQKILTANKDNQPLLSFLEIEEITSIYKTDAYWMRFSNTYDAQTFTRAYFSNGSKKEYADILSNREMEILNLIVAKKTTAEISELLNISKETILRHRKNMIARAGVKDMTGLIYLCRLCQVV